MLGKKFQKYASNDGLVVIYHGKIRKKSPTNPRQQHWWVTFTKPYYYQLIPGDDPIEKVKNYLKQISEYHPIVCSDGEDLPIRPGLPQQY